MGEERKANGPRRGRGGEEEEGQQSAAAALWPAVARVWCWCHEKTKSRQADILCLKLAPVEVTLSRLWATGTRAASEPPNSAAHSSTADAENHLQHRHLHVCDGGMACCAFDGALLNEKGAASDGQAAGVHVSGHATSSTAVTSLCVCAAGRRLMSCCWGFTTADAEATRVSVCDENP